MDLGYFEVDPEVERNTQAAIEVFRSLGAEVETVNLGWTESVAEAAAEHLTHLFGGYIGERIKEDPDSATDYVRAFAAAAGETTAEGLLASMMENGRMYASLGPVLERNRILICPTLALPAVKADHNPLTDEVLINGKEVDPHLGWCMTYPFNMLSRCPVMSLPSGFASNGVPTGIQIVGRTFDDVSVFKASAAYERAAPVLEWGSVRPAL